MDTTELAEIEEIKRLKSRYFSLMDTKRWDEWAEVFTDDAVMDVSDGTGQELVWRGRDQIVANVRGAIDSARTVHHGHMPDLRLTGAGSASGLWAMEDIVEHEGPDGSIAVHGYGHYHETYRKTGGRWQIASLRLTRLRVDPL